MKSRRKNNLLTGRQRRLLLALSASEWRIPCWSEESAYRTLESKGLVEAKCDHHTLSIAYRRTYSGKKIASIQQDRKKIINGRYEVDVDGNVFNAKTGNQLKPGRQSSGYLTVSLYDGTAPKHPKSYLVHRLVAGAFLGNSDLQINHIDGDKENNRVSNLEWCSAIHNREHYLSELKE